MRAVIQRVTRAKVSVAGQTVGEIGPGLCVLVGVTHDDGPKQIEKVARKIAQLKILRGPAKAGAGTASAEPAGGAVAAAATGPEAALPGGPEAMTLGDDDPRARRSAEEAGAPVLLVSQFTLYADVRKGTKPGWSAAAPGEVAEPIFNQLVEQVRSHGLHVETGRFGAMMEVELVNDGPMTILAEV